jgi:hypothetical protein
VLLLPETELEPVFAVATTLNTPLHPAGPAVTLLFTEPTPVPAEKVSAAAQLLLGFETAVVTNPGLYELAGVRLVVMTVDVSPVERFSCEGL